MYSGNSYDYFIYQCFLPMHTQIYSNTIIALLYYHNYYRQYFLLSWIELLTKHCGLNYARFRFTELVLLKKQMTYIKQFLCVYSCIPCAHFLPLIFIFALL